MTAVIPISSIRLSEPVLSMTPSPGGWQVATASHSKTFDQVVVATPVHIARKLVAPWNDELQSLLDIESSSAVVAAFAFDREQSAKLRIPEGFGFLVPQRYDSASPDAEPQLLACTFVDQKFAHRAPEGCVLLRAFFGGPSAPRLLTDQSDEAILTLARRRSLASSRRDTRVEDQLSSAAGHTHCRNTPSDIAPASPASRPSSAKSPVYTLSATPFTESAFPT